MANYELENSLLKEGYHFIAGIDEVGRGPLAGPVVGACVMLDPRFFADKERHILSGLNDCKKLSKKQRHFFYDKIFAHSLAIAISLLGASFIDQLNIRRAALLAMAKAVRSLAIAPDYILIDGRDKLDLACCQRALIKGDNISLSIAAASVVAKVVRDNMMTRLAGQYQHFAFAKNVGYGTKEHRQALALYGPIAKLHRFSFAPLRPNKAG